MDKLSNLQNVTKEIFTISKIIDEHKKAIGFIKWMFQMIMRFCSLSYFVLKK